MIAKFPGQKQYLSHVISREIAMRYYNKGIAEGTEPNNVNVSLQNATAIWDRVINQLSGPGVTAEACCYAGNSYLQLGDYQKALACYQKVANDYPMYRYGWRALAMAGQTCQVMKKAQLIPAAEADAQTKAVYQKLVDTYSECKDAEYAKNWLVNNNK
jgi:tetratricopeptide (TPR) repeat protein